MIKNIIIGVIIFLTLIILSVFIWEKFVRGSFIEEKIKIVKEIKTEYRIITVPKNTKEFLDCYNNKIKIETKMIDKKIMEIQANDNCKKTIKQLELEGTEEKNWSHIFVVGGALCTVTFIAGLGIASYFMCRK